MAFSRVGVQLLSRARLFAALWTVAARLLCRGMLQARRLEWAAMPCSRGLPDPGMELASPALQADS